MLFRNALATLAIRGGIRLSGHTQQPGDVRRTTIEVEPLPILDSIPWRRQTTVQARAIGVLS
jgi:hypothetical protein